MSGHPSPSDLVDLGIVYDAQGLKGHIKVRPYSPDPVALLASKEAYLQGYEAGAKPTVYRFLSVKIQSRYVVMLSDVFDDQDAASHLELWPL